MDVLFLNQCVTYSISQYEMDLLDFHTDSCTLKRKMKVKHKRNPHGLKKKSVKQTTVYPSK